MEVTIGVATSCSPGHSIFLAHGFKNRITYRLQHEGKGDLKRNPEQILGGIDNSPLSG
jgi:hypothetical protein